MAVSDVAGWVCREEKPAVVLVVGGVHPIRRHYTPSDRVYRNVT